MSLNRGPAKPANRLNRSPLGGRPRMEIVVIQRLSTLVKRYQIETNEEQIEVTIKPFNISSKTFTYKLFTIFVFLFLLAQLLLLVMMMIPFIIVLFYPIILKMMGPFFVQLLIYNLIPFAIAGIFFLLFYNYQVILVINNQGITVRYRYWIITKENQYLIDKIDNIQITGSSRTGVITFIYETKKINICQGLSSEDGKRIITQIMEKYSSYRQKMVNHKPPNQAQEPT
jgi:hypothetical protein